MRLFACAALAAMCLTGAAAATPSTGGRTVFEVLRNGQPFGRHTITVSGAPGNLRAESQVALRAAMGPVTVFRLEQRCLETWRDGTLAALDCSTLKDGRRTRVRADRQEDRLRVRGADGEAWFPLTALPASWWTRPPQGATLINTETGERMRARVTHAGREVITVAGRRIEADRVRVSGAVVGDLWYDTRGRWVACAFTARGQNVQYRLTTPPAAAPA